MKLGIFVTATDTGIGKTIVSSLLLSSLRSYSIRAGYFKPIQTGLELDTARVAELTGMPEDKFPAPAYSFPEPLAPSRAAQIHDQCIQIDSILEQWKGLDDRAWIVEGVGGLMVPLNPKNTVLDLVHAMGLKVLLVASTRLGTINHTLLTAHAAKAAGVSIAGIILVGEEDPGLDSLLVEFTGVPVLGRIPFLSELSPSQIQEKGSQYFPFVALRALFD